jgi:hypothetical protein
MALRFDGKVIETAESIATLMSVNASSVDIANVVNDFDSQDPLDQASAIVSTMAVIENFASLIKDTKKVGGPLVAASLYIDLAKIESNLDDDGYIHDSTFISAAASVAAGIAFVAAGVAGSAVIAPTLVVVGTMAAIGLGVTSLFANQDGEERDIQDALDGCWEALADTRISIDINRLMSEVGVDFTDGLNKTLDAAEAAAEYASDELVEFGQELKTKAQQLIDEAIESGTKKAEETWKDVVESIDKIEKAAIAADALVQAGVEEFVQAVEYMADRTQEVTEQIEQLGDSVAGMVVNTYLELAKRADELGDEAGEWVDSSIEKLVRIANDFGDYLTEEGSNLVNDIKATISDLFNNAQSAILRRDPLTLDLDGDGLETVGINSANPILFDHDGDGIKTATGWIKPDDGFLVLDRNGNGTIDDGTELFGDSTPLFDADGQVIGKAEDGFAALAQEDTNGDGVVNAQDANFNDLRIWRDLNRGNRGRTKRSC